MLFSGTNKREYLRNILSGGISGFACKITEYPLDTLKVIQQTSPYKVKLQDTYHHIHPEINVNKKCKLKYKRFTRFINYYKGVTVPLYGSILERSLLFLTYKTIQKNLNIDNNMYNNTTRFKYLIAGNITGFIYSTVITPIELLKCQMQTDSTYTIKKKTSPAFNTNIIKSTQKKNIIQRLKYIIHTDGLLGLWRGYNACILRDVIGIGIWYSIYEYYLNFIYLKNQYNNKNEIPLVYNAMIGSLSGLLHWIIPYPFDTIKTIIQTNIKYKNKTVLYSIKHLYKNNNLCFFYRGLPITCLRSIPSHAILFYMYEITNRTLLKY